MKRRWFRFDDGGYYRNHPLILDDIQRTPWWRWRKRRLLFEEFQQTYECYPRIAVLGWRDVVVEPLPMEQAYPDRPVFWDLDS